MSILVTGGSKGLGRATALRFACQDVDVFVNYHADEGAATRTAAEIVEKGGRAHLVRANIGTVAGARAAISAVAEVTDRLDQLVHCAVDTSLRGPMLEMDCLRFAEAVQCNGSALLPLVQFALPLFRPGSAVVFVTSRGSQVAVAGYGAVGAPKALGEALIAYLAVELAPLGVRANMVSASALDTEALRSVLSEERALQWLDRAAARNPSGRRVELSEVVDAIEFLCSDRATMVQGQRLNVDGGFYLR
ncbi:enoyl-[acyl-carrier-protein] reductase FabL [Acidothermaceae bacterium B102]|nr:enoyl-[acyl-carrier-protein] reductase FabL [Acidothermaceae bacterium B102]